MKHVSYEETQLFKATKAGSNSFNETASRTSLSSMLPPIQHKLLTGYLSLVIRNKKATRKRIVAKIKRLAGNWHTYWSSLSPSLCVGVAGGREDGSAKNASVHCVL